MGLLSFEVLDEVEVSFPSVLDDAVVECELENVLEASVDGERLLSVRIDGVFEGGLPLLGVRWLCFLEDGAPLGLCIGSGG